MAIGDLQVGEAARRQIEYAMDAPVRSLAGWPAEACAVGDPDAPAMPERRRADLLQKRAAQGFQERDGSVEALAQGLVGEAGDAAFARPGRHVPHGMTAAGPGEHQAQQIGGRSDTARASKGLGPARQTLDIDTVRQAFEEGGEMVDQLGGCFGHSTTNHTGSSQVKHYLSAYGAEP